MQRMFICVLIVIVILLFGCNSNSFVQAPPKNTELTTVEQVEEAPDDEAVPFVLEESSELIEIGNEFSDPYVNGELLYIVESSNVYNDIKQAEIEEQLFLEPHNLYYLQEVGEQYQEVSDFLREDGAVVETHRLIVVDVTIYNKDAFGLFKKNEFSVSDISLYGESNSRYNVAYFSEQGILDETQPFHYELNQGEKKKIKLAYFVLKEDVNHLIGRTNDIQFSVYK